MIQRTRATRHTVSVVIPCYNARPYVRETLDSVLSQSYPWVDVVVVDDGSTDGSWEVLQEYGRRVRAFRKENGGAAKARNAGAARAVGKSLLFLDADDTLAPDTLESLVDAAEGRDDVIAACRWERLHQEEGRWVNRPAEIPFPIEGPDPLAAWLQGQWIAGCSLLWPRPLFERLGGYDETLTSDEDGDIMYRALASGARLLTATGGTSFYRHHGSARISLSTDVFAEHRVRSRLRVYQKLEAQLAGTGRSEEYRVPLGVAYHELAQQCFATHPAVAREALARGEALAGRRAVSPTLAGRVLVYLLGMEGKERVAQGLAALGLRTRGRRDAMERARLGAESTPLRPEMPR